MAAAISGPGSGDAGLLCRSLRLPRSLPGVPSFDLPSFELDLLLTPSPPPCPEESRQANRRSLAHRQTASSSTLDGLAHSKKIVCVQAQSEPSEPPPDPPSGVPSFEPALLSPDAPARTTSPPALRAKTQSGATVTPAALARA